MNQKEQQRRSAVALAYREGSVAPKVTAKGQGELALRIIERAQQAGVFVHESPQLVNLLMQVDLDSQIPPELYQAVAEVLAFVYWLEQQQGGGTPPEHIAPPLPLPPIPGLREGANTVRALHARWAAEEAMLRRDMPDFSLKQELANPEMRRLMELPGMRMGDAYRLAHYNDALRQTAQTVEQGVVERIRQRSARPAENGTSPGGAAITRADVASMTRAQREALERRAMHGVKISF